MKDPIMLPNSRIHNESGLMNISRILIGATMATGSARFLAQPPKPRLLIPENSIRHMLIRASAAVIFRSFVGGLNPKKLTMVFAKAR